MMRPLPPLSDFFHRGTVTVTAHDSALRFYRHLIGPDSMSFQSLCDSCDSSFKEF
jgi:hypothetical protein